MFKNAFLLIFLLITAVWIGVQLSQDPGQAIWIWKDTAVEMPLWFAAIGGLASIYMTWQLSRLFSALPHTLYRLKRWQQQRHINKQNQHLQKGLLALFTHQWAQAEKYLRQETPPPEFKSITFLAAAYAAHQQKVPQRRDAWLTQAGPTSITPLLEADFAMDDQHPERVIELLKKDTNQPAALLRLQKAYRRLEQWEALLKLIPALRKAKIISEEKVKLQERKIASKWLSTAKSADALQTIWRQLPKTIQLEPRIARHYIRLLAIYPKTQLIIDPLITRALNHYFDATFARLYGQIDIQNLKKQLNQAEKWLKMYPSQPTLLITAGQLAIRSRLWGKARGYLNDCLKINSHHPKAHALLGKLDEQQGDSSTALDHYRQSCHALLQAD